MSTVHGGWRGPNIVKDGLVLYLDAGSPNSFYPLNAGTTWKDISGNNNNGTLINGPTYNSANGGSILFDGVDDYVNMNNLGFSLMGTGVSSTVCLWTKINNISPGRNMVIFEQSNTASNRYVIWFQNSTTSLNFYPNAMNHRTSAISANVWYFITTIVNGLNSRMFVNTTEIGLATSYTPQNTNSSFWLGLGPIYSNECWIGNLTQTLIYNRALSASEIQQNFNATRGRFGI